MNRVLIWVAAFVAALVLVWFLAALLFGRTAILQFLSGAPQREALAFESLVPPATPNSYLVCPPDLCRAAPEVVPSPAFAVPAGRLRAAWMEMLERQNRVTVLREDDALQQLDVEQRSLLIGYPDTVTVRFLPLAPDRSTLAVFSRSHYGRSDFGVNRERVQDWLGDLEL